MAQNVIEVLKEDHAHLCKLLSDLVSTTNGSQKQLLDQIETALMLHTQFEEEVFYPAFASVASKEDSPLYHQALEEHRAVEERVLPDLKDADPGSDEFIGRARVLQKLIESHINEEETVLFPKAQKLLDTDLLEELADELIERKSEAGE